MLYLLTPYSRDNCAILFPFLCSSTIVDLNTLSYLFVPFISDTCLLSISLYNQDFCVHFFIRTPINYHYSTQNKKNLFYLMFVLSNSQLPKLHYGFYINFHLKQLKLYKTYYHILLFLLI